MEITGAPDGPPQMVGDNIGDSVPGVWTALGIMMALETRRKTGRGQHLDMAMYDCMVAHTTSIMPFYQATGQVTTRARENMITAQLALKASDGYAVLAGSGGGGGKWEGLWRLIGREELIEDPVSWARASPASSISTTSCRPLRNGPSTSPSWKLPGS